MVDRCLATGSIGGGAGIGGLDGGPVALLDQFPRDDPKNLLDPLPVFGADLMAAVPANVLAPEGAAAFAVGVLQTARGGGQGHRGAPQGDGQAGGRWWGGGLGGIELLGHVGDGAFEGDATAGVIERDDVGFGPDDVDDEGLLIVCSVLFELEEPAGHVPEALLIRDVVAEQAGMGAPIVEAGDAPEALLAGRIPDLKANEGVGSTVQHALGDEGRTDGGGGGSWIEGILDVAVHQGGLSNACAVSSWPSARDFFSFLFSLFLSFFPLTDPVSSMVFNSPLPWAPSTTSLASREELMVSKVACDRQRRRRRRRRRRGRTTLPWNKQLARRAWSREGGPFPTIDHFRYSIDRWKMIRDGGEDREREGEKSMTEGAY